MRAAETPNGRAPDGEPRRLLAAAQGGDELAFRRLLQRHQGLLEQQVARFYLPGGDSDDLMQEARIGFAKAVRGYRVERGASFRGFARRCVTRQLATALTAATRRKHRPLNEAMRGDDAVEAWENGPGGEDPGDQAVARELLGELPEAAGSLTGLERQLLGHAIAGWSSGEAARRLGIERKSADNALQRARRKMEEWHETRAA